MLRLLIGDRINKTCKKSILDEKFEQGEKEEKEEEEGGKFFGGNHLY